MSLEDIVKADGTLIPGDASPHTFWRQVTCPHQDQIKDPEDPDGYAICATCGAKVELDVSAILLRGIAAIWRQTGGPR